MVTIKISASAAMIFILINITTIKADFSGGKLSEYITKSRQRVVHIIEVKASLRSQVSLLLNSSITYYIIFFWESDFAKTFTSSLLLPPPPRQRAPIICFQFATLPTLRDPIIMNRRPGEQILQNDTDVIITCLRGWKEPDCQRCAHGWTGGKCDTCALNYGPPGECTSCLLGWDEPDCLACAENYGPPGECDQCLRGWTGENCTERCPLGWGGQNCNLCEFGFNKTTNCTECIQNGYWTGRYHIAQACMEVYLSFEGAGCTNLVPGIYIIYYIWRPPTRYQDRSI